MMKRYLGMLFLVMVLVSMAATAFAANEVIDFGMYNVSKDNYYVDRDGKSNMKVYPRQKASIYTTSTTAPSTGYGFYIGLVYTSNTDIWATKKTWNRQPGAVTHPAFLSAEADLVKYRVKGRVDDDYPTDTRYTFKGKFNSDIVNNF